MGLTEGGTAMGRHNRISFSGDGDRSLGPTFSPRSVFDEILDDWISHLDDQLATLSPDSREHVRVEAARSAYEGLRKRAAQ